MQCKNKEVVVRGMEYNRTHVMVKNLCCICTNDEKGKTLSINNGVTQFTIPFEAVEECFKGDYRRK